MAREALGSGATVLPFGGSQRQMLPGPVGDLEAARLASGAANVVAYISDPATPSSGTASCTWAEVTAAGGHVAVAELVAGEGVHATAAIAAESGVADQRAAVQDELRPARVDRAAQARASATTAATGRTLGPALAVALPAL